MSSYKDRRNRQVVNIKEEYFQAIENRDIAIMMRDQKIEEQNQKIEEQHKAICNMAKALKSSGMPIEEISVMTHLNIDEISAL